jgi:phosphotriesterase-related protein
MATPGEVMTVTGPVAAANLGVTLMHEHLLLDIDWPGLWPDASAWPDLVDVPVGIETLGVLRRDPFALRDNARLDDVGLAVEEAARFRAAGGRTIVEVTSTGIHPDPAGLREIARATGLNVVAGCGWYVGPSHPAELAAADPGALARRLVADLTEGIGDSGVRAGVIGEVGTFNPIRPTERTSLLAAARAHRETGAAISVHLSSRDGGNVRQVVELLSSEGVDPRRVALGHIDLGIDQEDRYFAVDNGYNVQFDTFGHEHYYSVHPGAYAYIWRDPRDFERVAWIEDLVRRGYVEHVLLSQDICVKTMLRRYGGFGYDHLLTNVVPMMRERSTITDGQIQVMLAANPARVLAGG